MSQSTLDDRTFETATTLTPEEQLINKQHFEAKGYEIEVVPEEGEAAIPVPEEPKPVEPVVATPESVPPADDTVIDPESKAEWDSAANDGQKLGRLAKKTKKITELTAEKEAGFSERDARIRELERKLAERPAAPATPPLAPPSAVTVEPPKPQTPAPIEAKKFEKPRPALPKFEDFSGEDDPHAAFAAANGKHAESISDWKDEKRDFDRAETTRVDTETSQRNQQQTQQTERARIVNQRFQEIEREHPDFYEKTRPIAFTSTLRYLMIEKIPDGLKLGYELSKPENAAVLNDLIAKFPETKDPNVALQQIDDGIAELAVFRHTIKARASAPPAPPAPVAVVPSSATPPPPPSNIPPRREEAAPAPTRGRGVVPISPADVDPMDSDARRKLRGMKTQVG